MAYDSFDGDEISLIWYQRISLIKNTESRLKFLEKISEWTEKVWFILNISSFSFGIAQFLSIILQAHRFLMIFLILNFWHYYRENIPISNAIDQSHKVEEISRNWSWNVIIVDIYRMSGYISVSTWCTQVKKDRFFRISKKLSSHGFFLKW